MSGSSPVSSDPPSGFTGRLMGGGLASIGLRLVSKLLALILAVLLARSLGAEGYGAYAYVIALISLLAIPAQFGMPQLLVRETARAVVDEDWGRLRGLWLWSNRVVCIISAGVAVAASFVALLLVGRLGVESMLLFFIALLLIPLIALGNLRGSALYGLRKVVAGQIPEYLARPVLFIGIVAMFSIYLSEPLTPIDAVMAHAMAAALAFLLGVGILRRSWPKEMGPPRPTPVYRKLEWSRSVIPLGLIAAMQLLTTHIDVVILGWFEDAESVGVYRVAAQAAILVAFGLDAINTVVAPSIARLHRQLRFDELQYVATHSALYSTGIAFIVIATFVVFGEELLRVVFGSEFAAGNKVLLVLCIGQAVNAAVGSVGYILKMCGYERDVATAVAGSAVVNIVLNLLLIPGFGEVGAAVATACSLTILNVYLAWRVYSRLSINSTIIPFSGKWPGRKGS